MYLLSLSMEHTQKSQINCRVNQEVYHKLKALANGYKHKCCPTCGKTWDLPVLGEPIPHSVLASQLLEAAILDKFDKASFGRKS